MLPSGGQCPRPSNEANTLNDPPTPYNALLGSSGLPGGRGLCKLGGVRLARRWEGDSMREGTKRPRNLTWVTF